MGKHSKKTTRPALRAVLILLALVLMLLVLAALIGLSLMNKINRADPSEQEFLAPEDEFFEADYAEDDGSHGAPVLDPEDVIWEKPGYTEPEEDPDDILNFMLIGQDRREGEKRARSDTMILLSVNKTDGTICLVSFMRDLYVQIPGYSDNRLNAAYAFGGMPLLDATIEENFGIEIDGNIEVDFSGFTDIINLLGGVDLYLSAGEAEYLGFEGEGSYHLDGEQALTYARIRSLDSDFARTSRQRNVLSALFTAFKSTSLTNAIGFINSAFPLVTTDLSNAEMIAYATELLPMMSGCTLETGRIPVDDGYYNAVIRGMMVLVPDLSVNREALQEFLHTED